VIRSTLRVKVKWPSLMSRAKCLAIFFALTTSPTAKPIFAGGTQLRAFAVDLGLNARKFPFGRQLLSGALLRTSNVNGSGSLVVTCRGALCEETLQGGTRLPLPWRVVRALVTADPTQFA
jgi:hypothetical protein